SCVTAVLMADSNPNPWPIVPAIGAGLLVGAVVGLINGLLIEVAGISPVIATLGTLIAVRGLGQIIINNTWVWLTDPLFETIAADKIIFLPVMAAIMFILYIIVAVVLRQTQF